MRDHLYRSSRSMRSLCSQAAVHAEFTPHGQTALHEGALQRRQQRATPAAMQLRRRTVEHPFAILKYVIFGHPRFLLRGLEGTRSEVSLAVMAYNLKRS